MGRFVNSTGTRVGGLVNWPGSPSYTLDGDYAARELQEYVLECVNNYTNKKGFFQEAYLLFDRVLVDLEKDSVNVQVFLYDGLDLDGVRERDQVEGYKFCLAHGIADLVKKLYGKECFVSYKMLNNDEITANLLARYIEIKLFQGFSVGGILGPLQKILAQCPKFLGYRIDLSGRFTRKQRASKFSYNGGSVPFSTVESNVEYAEGSVILKYGKCGVKVWTQLR